jgi:hypothetical protein
MDQGIRSRLGLPVPDPDRSRKDLRAFGFGLAVILLVLSALAWRRGRPPAPYELGLALLSALLAVLRPQALQPVYGPWMKGARWLGKANTWLVMALFYYFVLTPYAVLVRWLSGDLLDERLRDRDSYWHTRPAPPAPESYHHQF